MSARGENVRSAFITKQGVNKDSPENSSRILLSWEVSDFFEASC